MQKKQPVNRQVALNTLTAMHQRFSFSGLVQHQGKPIEFRACATKSLDALRKTIQSAITRDIDYVIRRYLEKFFVPAVKNIRSNLGKYAVSEDQVKAVCCAMLDAARLVYMDQPESGESSTQSNFGIKPEDFLNKRKRPDSEMDFTVKRKKMNVEMSDGVSPSPPTSPVLRDLDKWDPARLTSDTLFIMGSHAHKVLGLGKATGSLYSRHAGLPRYLADSADKEWIAGRNLINAVGVQTYIMVLEDIQELAKTETYKHTSLPMLGELTGFKAPQFMLRKIKAFVQKQDRNEDSVQPSTSTNIPATQPEEPYQLDNIKIEPHFDTENFNASQYNIADASNNCDDFSDVPSDSDLCDLKVEDMGDFKVDDDLDVMKVDGIKVEDLVADIDVKLEHLDDIEDVVAGIDVKIESVDAIDAIKLEHDDFSICKQPADNENVGGLVHSDMEFSSGDWDDIECNKDVTNAIASLGDADTDTPNNLVGDHYNVGHAFNAHFPNKEIKCITVQSTADGVVHSVPVTHITPRRITGNTVHYYTTPAVAGGDPRKGAHVQQPAVTIQSVPSSLSQLIGIPINCKPGSFSTVLSQGSADGAVLTLLPRAPDLAIVKHAPQYARATPSFPTGIVSRNILASADSGVSFTLSAWTPPPTPTPTPTPPARNTLSERPPPTGISKAANSSVMLKQVLTLGGTGTKSFMMQNTQKVLASGFGPGPAPPPNVTVLGYGSALGIVNKGRTPPGTGTGGGGTLSATHATLSALLSAGDVLPTSTNK